MSFKLEFHKLMNSLVTSSQYYIRNCLSVFPIVYRANRETLHYVLLNDMGTTTEFICYANYQSF